jgi:hypothetical protein
MPGTPESSGRVFVSSTCYDLLDLRASLEVTLRACGLLPVMSDRPTSEFTNPGDKNSIETCLVNLRSCERCIVILSQRYGPSLNKAGFDDVSATHLEYREAVKAGIPVGVYVRDRLWAEHNLAKRNAGMATAWAKAEDAQRLFAFIDEHETLVNGDKPNWMWPFTSSVELCDRVLRDLGGTASAAMIRMLSDQGRLPQFSITVNKRAADGFDAVIRNTGSVGAVRVSVRDPNQRVVKTLEELGTIGAGDGFKFEFSIPMMSACGGRAPVFQVDYETKTGERMTDLLAVLLDRDHGIRLVPAGRVYIGRALRSTSPEVRVVGGYATVALEPINAAHNLNAL